MDRLLRNTSDTFSVTFSVDADADVTVIVKRADGTTLLSTTATNEADPGVYSVEIPAQANLNILTLTWTGTFSGSAESLESTVEIVGGYYFSIDELRNTDNVIKNNLVRFPDELLVDVRMQVEAEFEDICNRAFVPRYYRETGVVVEGDGTLWLEKPEPINVLSLSVDGVDKLSWVTDGYIKRDKFSPRGMVLSDDAYGALYAENIDMEYEYGLTRVPIPIKQKALKRGKMLLLGMNSTIDERALTMTLPDIGTVNLATPGVRGAETGVPDIDVVLRRYTLGGEAGVF